MLISHGVDASNMHHLCSSADKSMMNTDRNSADELHLVLHGQFMNISAPKYESLDSTRVTVLMHGDLEGHVLQQQCSHKTRVIPFVWKKKSDSHPSYANRMQSLCMLYASKSTLVLQPKKYKAITRLNTLFEL